MYISHIYISNVKCFSEVDISFDLSKETPQWTTLLGDNGTGKTTFLKCIGMGLCDATSAAGLLREIPWEIRSKIFNEDSVIRITLTNDKKNKYTIETTVTSKNNIERIIRKIVDINGEEIYDEDYNWDKIFICGYGAARGTEGTQDYSKYSIIDAVYTVYRYDQPLQNPELALRRLIQKLSKVNGSSEDDVLDWIKNILKPILQLSDQDDILLEEDGIWILNQNWGKVPLSSLGDGYKSTLTWIMDFISWSSIYHGNIIKNAISGIVIVDELEQHLHPKWQRKVINDLRKVFPKVQFIVTTHSPLIVANADLFSNPSYVNKIYHFGFLDKIVIVDELEEINGVLSCDQILASKAFDYIININSEVEHILIQASSLAAKKVKTEEEEKKYSEIKELLKNIMFPSGRTLIERIVEREYYEELEKQNERFNKILNEKTRK